MAESTSTAANSSYDVFLNHRGPDVKKIFASHLYRRLLSHGIRVFLDQSELQSGEYLTPQIESAIRSASVHVAIFSNRYAESSWCLNELLLMLESKSPIIPVFYQVHPADLRWTHDKKRKYGEALEELRKKTAYEPHCHEKKLRYQPDTLENWRNALSHVADISGFELAACNGDEGELVDKIVERVLKKVKKPALDVAKYPTGLDDKVKDFENTVLLQRQQNGKPQILGIMGLGGVGKTTLAKEFFNRKSSDYSRTCFLADVRDNASKGYLNSLQGILLKSLIDLDKSINNVSEGKEMLRKPLSSSRALIILDDVHDVDEVDALLPHQNVHSDSLIVITSRNKDVLTSSKVESASIYNLTGLDTQQSRELFCFHAFNQSHPLPGFESVIMKFLETCNGLPLSLKVFGALLYGKEVYEWEDQLGSLQQILPTTQIYHRFKISYNSLNKAEQHIFLDIACFFSGQNKDMAIRVWDGSGWKGRQGFQNLRSKCLVEVDSKNDIQMHPHLRDMGREIAEDAGLPRRIWGCTENATRDLLQQSANGQVIPVRGIRMLNNESNDALGCIRMMTLQLLVAEGVLLERILTNVQFPDLIWLRWNNCPSFSLPLWVSMKNLRVLQVEGSRLKTLWEESQVPLQLRELEIKAPLSNIPKSIGKLKHLERIVIGPSKGNSVIGEIDLTKLPEEFCLLRSLKVLVLRGCTKMESLPECFYKLTNLQHMDLSWCEEMKSLPECFGKLSNLQHIDLSGCSALERLPYSFSELMKLQYLNLEYCTNLTMSSETLGNISTFEHINLSLCSKIEVFPWQVTHQRSLKQLHMVGLNIKELPSAIGELSDLEVMKIGGFLMDTLPPSLCDLKNLKELYIYQCKELKCLPASLGDLKNLMKLSIRDLNELKCLPASLGLLTQLTELTVENCPLMSNLPLVKAERQTLTNLDNCILPRLRKLEVVNTGTSEVSFAEGICFNLPHLNISCCRNLVEVGTLPYTLKYLAFYNCANLRKIGRIYGLAKLQELDISGSIELEELPSIETLVSLSALRASGCVMLKSIRGLEQVTQLRELDVSGCSDLEALEGIQGCMSLEALYASECAKLKSIQGLEQLTKLRELRITGCSDLETLEGIQGCMSLEALYASECAKLKSIHGLGQLTKLRELDVSACSELEALEGIQGCMSLEAFNASECAKLKRIQELGQLTKLRELDVNGWSELGALEGNEDCMAVVDTHDYPKMPCDEEHEEDADDQEEDDLLWNEAVYDDDHEEEDDADKEDLLWNDDNDNHHEDNDDAGDQEEQDLEWNDDDDDHHHEDEEDKDDEDDEEDKDDEDEDY